MNKCKNKPVVTPDGIKHASKREANRWMELLIMERAGEIWGLDRQVVFPLIPKQVETYPRFGAGGKRLKDGERVIERGVDYIADFVYHDCRTGKKVVEDTKGFRGTSSAVYAKFVIKRKLMLWIYGIRIKEV
jgi:hypothetical protein